MTSISIPGNLHFDFHNGIDINIEGVGYIAARVSTDSERASEPS